MPAWGSPDGMGGPNKPLPQLGELGGGPPVHLGRRGEKQGGARGETLSLHKEEGVGGHPKRERGGDKKNREERVRRE